MDTEETKERGKKLLDEVKNASNLTQFEIKVAEASLAGEDGLSIWVKK